jgi:alpha-L-arabinofuranosidase
VWSGLAIGNPSTIVPKDQLQPYIDDAIAQIEFITADATTNKWGALRASLGREKPYELKYIEM